MKRMEKVIALTFAIIFVVSMVINGIYSVTTLEAGFFTKQVFAEALLWALTYLFYVWCFSRKHQLLTWLGLLCIAFVAVLTGYASTYNELISFDIITLICFTTMAIIGKYHSKKLLKESEEPIVINININGNCNLQDIEVSIGDK